MNKFICIHGHFYQPPRENPWTDTVEVQPSANPYHDWNERIAAECYDPNSRSTILGRNDRLIRIVNNYTKMSFNFGPTLLTWMEKYDSDVYRLILEADKESQQYFAGHGAAIAQAYNHTILPLSNDRDKRTQIIWGIKDFEYRFKRLPEGMWLPETAVDVKTLEILAEYGIKFTILAPGQVKRVRKSLDKEWENVNEKTVDTHVPYLCKLSNGKEIAIFFYNGQISHEIAFGDLLKNGEKFALRLIKDFNTHSDKPQLVHIATDGETYGHHHKFGNMALSYLTHYIEAKNLPDIIIYGEFLEKHPPTCEVEIKENSSWSCAHGVERWNSDCGCRIDPYAKSNQKWRRHLRAALDFLRDALIPIYEKEMLPFSQRPWEMRDEFIEVILNRSEGSWERFLVKFCSPSISKEGKMKVLSLLEMQRFMMFMYTSCGWFFDDISRIETIQILQYAARAIQIAKEITGNDMEEEFLKLLELAKSNDPEIVDGRKVYELFVRTVMIKSMAENS